MPSSAELVAKDGSWRERSELDAMAELSPELEKELERLDGEFWVPGEKLKEIVKRFQQELNAGTFDDYHVAKSAKKRNLTIFARSERIRQWHTHERLMGPWHALRKGEGHVPHPGSRRHQSTCL